MTRLLMTMIAAVLLALPLTGPLRAQQSQDIDLGRD